MSPPQDAHLERWIEAFRGPLIGLVASWGSDWRAAEELAQDVFAEAWVARERFRGSPGDLHAAGAWLRGIAWNLHCAARRGAARRPGPLDPAEAAPLEPGEPVDERREALVKAFAALDPRHQTVLRMAYLEDSSTVEVAALLGVTHKAAENRLYQARRALRDVLGRQAVDQVFGART